MATIARFIPGKGLYTSRRRTATAVKKRRLNPQRDSGVTADLEEPSGMLDIIFAESVSSANPLMGPKQLLPEGENNTTCIPGKYGCCC